MKLLLFVVGVPVILLVSYLIYRARVGHVTAIHLHRFETLYDKTLNDTRSKELALRLSLVVFRDCPILNQLSDDDYERIIDILADSDYAKEAIITTILKMDAKTSLRALRNSEFLAKMAAVGDA